MTITLLDPTAERGSVERPGAPRPATLDGQVVALLDISKPRGEVFLDQLATRGVEHLSARSLTRRLGIDLAPDS